MKLLLSIASTITNNSPSLVMTTDFLLMVRDEFCTPPHPPPLSPPPPPYTHSHTLYPTNEQLASLRKIHRIFWLFFFLNRQQGTSTGASRNAPPSQREGGDGWAMCFGRKATSSQEPHSAGHLKGRGEEPGRLKTTEEAKLK